MYLSVLEHACSMATKQPRVQNRAAVQLQRGGPPDNRTADRTRTGVDDRRHPVYPKQNCPPIIDATPTVGVITFFVTSFCKPFSAAIDPDLERSAVAATLEMLEIASHRILTLATAPC